MAKVGRPPKFKSVDELQKKIQHYFDSITLTSPAFDMIFDYTDADGKDHFKQVPRLNNTGEQVYTTTYYEHPSILGMCRHLDIHRDNLLEYEKKEEYHDTIKNAKQKIEEYVAEQLYRKDQVTGIIFNLKNNFGWRDKTEQEITGADGGPLKVRLEDFF